MSRGPDAGTALRRAIERCAREAGCAVAVTATDATRWVSATFTGMRHRLILAAESGPPFEAWLDALPEADLPIRGHLVADLAIVTRCLAGGHANVTVEALTVES